MRRLPGNRTAPFIDVRNAGNQRSDTTVHLVSSDFGYARAIFPVQGARNRPHPGFGGAGSPPANGQAGNSAEFAVLPQTRQHFLHKPLFGAGSLVRVGAG